MDKGVADGGLHNAVGTQRLPDVGLAPFFRIEKPRILLLDCNLEYKKGESKTDAELMKQEDLTKILQLEVRGKPSSPTSSWPKRAFPVRPR